MIAIDSTKSGRDVEKRSSILELSPLHEYRAGSDTQCARQKPKESPCKIVPAVLGVETWSLDGCLALKSPKIVIIGAEHSRSAFESSSDKAAKKIVGD